MATKHENGIGDPRAARRGMRRSWWLSLLVILTFVVAFYGQRILSGYVALPVFSGGLAVAWYYLWWLGATLVVAGIGCSF
jgi:hypothetical protein